MSYYQQAGLGGSQGVNFDQFFPDTSSPMIPQEAYRPAAGGRGYLSTDGILGDLVPVRSDIGGFPTAVVLVGGIVLAGFLVMTMMTTTEPKRAF